MELVDIEHKGSALGLGQVVPGEGRVHDAGDDETAKDVRCIGPQVALGEVHDQNAAFVHDPTEPQRLYELTRDTQPAGLVVRRT
ncbi:hypothetical protein [Sinisalibacter aestuarii]|uniref:hypothetical protein n=1 Tax=Sinisalibacter aestuarii TaxID=2949426 RepID=UPI00248FC915|nr:hypothetical protein [Sinisalibacter aestuarii]